MLVPRWLVLGNGRAVRRSDARLRDRTPAVTVAGTELREGQVVSEEWLRHAVDTVVRFVEAAGAIVIAAGALIAFVYIAVALARRNMMTFVRARLLLGRFLALGLEFQLASDILKTAVAPSFEEIGKLAAIAAIRTGLNYFLAKEIKEERAQLEHEGDARTPVRP